MLDVLACRRAVVMLLAAHLLLAAGCGRVGFGDAGHDAAGLPDGAAAGVDAGGDLDAAVDSDAGPPPRVLSVFVPPPGAYVTNETVTVVVQFSGPVEVTGVPYVKLALDTDVVHAPYAFGAGSPVLHFNWIVEPGHVDATGISVDHVIYFEPGGAIRAAGADAVLLPVGSTSAPNVLINASAHCPDGFVFVTANPLYGERDFCVQKWEARLGGTGLAVVTSEGTPPEVTKAAALEACAALGPGYALITNEEWQVVARDVEWSAENWSALSQGEGFLSVGNFSTELGGSLGDDRPCETEGALSVRFPNCTNHASSEFVRNRTHRLSNGQLVWDLGGNRQEWVQGTYPTAPRAYVCSLAGADRLAFGPEGTYTTGCPATEAGPTDGRNLGLVEGTGGVNVFRGSLAGLEGTVWDGTVGIFYANANPFWDAGQTGPSFRCAFHPPTTVRAIPAVQPARVRVRAGGRQRFAVRGPAGEMVLGVNRSGASFESGTYVAGATSDTRDELTVALPGGGTITAWIDVVPSP